MVDDPFWFSGKEHCWGGYKKVFLNGNY